MVVDIIEKILKEGNDRLDSLQVIKILIDSEISKEKDRLSAHAESQVDGMSFSDLNNARMELDAKDLPNINLNEKIKELESMLGTDKTSRIIAGNPNTPSTWLYTKAPEIEISSRESGPIGETTSPLRRISNDE
jgi:hypothetical protein